MNVKERANAVRAMEMLVRSVNNEELIEPWLMCGVADGDIDENTTDDDLECYLDDDTFADLMYLFTKIMSRAHKDGGLYIDKVVSRDE